MINIPQYNLSNLEMGWVRGGPVTGSTEDRGLFARGPLRLSPAGPSPSPQPNGPAGRLSGRLSQLLCSLMRPPTALPGGSCLGPVAFLWPGL